MSKIQVNDIVNHFDDGAPNFPKGIVVGSGATLGFNVGTGASIYSPSDNVLTLGTNNTEKVRITSAGDVGVGNNNPSYKVSIKDTKEDGTGVQLHLWNNSVNNTPGNVWSGIRFSTSTGDYETAEIKGWRSHPGTNLNSLSINTGGVERMVLSSSGVGIGTNVLAASSRLTLFEESGNGQTLEIKAKNSGGAGSQPGIKFTAPNGDNIGGIYGDVNSDSLYIQTGGTNNLIIDSSGVVTKPNNPSANWSIQIPNSANHIRTFTEKRDAGSNLSGENAGNGSSHGSVGRFTAPVAGVYLFTIRGMSTTNTTANNELLSVYGAWSASNVMQTSEEVIDTRGATIGNDGFGMAFTLYMDVNNHWALDWYRANTSYTNNPAVWDISVVLLG